MKGKRAKSRDLDRVTIEDVARRAGVSTATVSRVLSGRFRVGTGTKKKVLEASRELGYIPNDVARSLKVKSTGTIGFISHGIGSSYFGGILRGIERTGRELGLELILGSSEEDPTLEDSIIQTFLQRRVEGMLIAPCSSERNLPLYRDLVERGFAIVFIDRHLPGLEVDYVTTANMQGGHLAASHLISQGYRRIVVIVGPEWNCPEVQDRVKGYETAIAELGGTLVDMIALDSGAEPHRGSVEENGYLSLMELDRRHGNGFDGVLCINDSLAIGAMRALWELGREVPREVGVVGFDDISVARFFQPSLTTVTQPAFEMGRQAVLHLASKIRNPEVWSTPLRLLLEPTLVCRESSARKA